MKKKKVVEQPNTMYCYGEDGKLESAYWQDKPFKVVSGLSYSLPKKLWCNPIWRLKQRLTKKITFDEWRDKIINEN